MVASRTIWACAGLASVLGQDLFISSSGGRRRRSVPSDSSYLVGVRNCGRTDVFQSWTFDNATGLIQMRHTELAWEAFCLGVDVKEEIPIVAKCSESDVTQEWAQEPNSQGGHRWRNVAHNFCLQLDASDDDSEAVTVGICNDVPAAGWFEETDAFPLNLLRTVVFDEPSKQRKCLSAVPQDDLPGNLPVQDGSVCQHIMEMLPDISVPFIGPIDAPLGIKASLQNFTLQLPELVGNFTSCGFYAAEPGSLASHKGTLTLDMDIPQIPFDLPWWHVERPPAHLTGSAEGGVHAVISLSLDYNLVNLSLECSGFDIQIPDLKLKLHGGGLLDPVVKAVTGAIKSVIKNKVPAIADPLVCPVINSYAEVVNQCSDAASRGAKAFALCILDGPRCTKKPCYACNHVSGTCSEVKPLTSHSTGSLDDCSTGCRAPAPPPAPCIEDGQCTDGGVEHSCCTGRIHNKGLGCKYGTCGCLGAGNCTGVGHHSDCCSGKAHKSLLCDALLGWRCK